MTAKKDADPIYYEAQERAMAPGIAGEWPEVIYPPKMKHARLIKTCEITLLKAELSVVKAARDIWERNFKQARRRLKKLRAEIDSEFFTCPECGCHWFRTFNHAVTDVANWIRNCKGCGWKGKYWKDQRKKK